MILFMAWGVGMGVRNADALVGVPMLPLMGVGQ